MADDTETLQTLQLAFNLAPVGMCVSRDRVVSICNEAFARMFGYDVGDLLGKPLAPLYPSQDEFTHVGNKVTFEVLMERFGLDKDRALVTIGTSVHFLDVGGALVGDAQGLETVLKGVKEKASSDDAMLAEAMRIFDHVYSAHARRKA